MWTTLRNSSPLPFPVVLLHFICWNTSYTRGCLTTSLYFWINLWICLLSASRPTSPTGMWSTTSMRTILETSDSFHSKCEVISIKTPKYQPRWCQQRVPPRLCSSEAKIRTVPLITCSLKCDEMLWLNYNEKETPQRKISHFLTTKECFLFLWRAGWFPAPSRVETTLIVQRLCHQLDAPFYWQWCWQWPWRCCSHLHWGEVWTIHTDRDIVENFEQHLSEVCLIFVILSFTDRHQSVSLGF